MAKRNEVYKCPECGNIVEVLVPTDKEVCGFKLLKENTTDAATEKHVPVVEKIDGGYRVTGYLVGTTDRWNSAKLAELNDRVVHK